MSSTVKSTPMLRYWDASLEEWIRQT